MEFEATMYDVNGNEMVPKEGHLFVYGQNCYTQIPYEIQEVQFVYRNIETKMIEEYGGSARFNKLKKILGKDEISTSQ